MGDVKSQLAAFARRQRQNLRYRAINLGRYAWEETLLRLGFGVSEATREDQVRVLVLSDAREGTSEEQLYPLSYYRTALREELHTTSVHLLLKDGLRCPTQFLRGFDFLILKMSFRTPRAEVVGNVEHLRAAVDRVPIVYFDGDDDICIQWPEILPLIDLYVKKHAFRDRSLYLQRYVGKSNLTDFVNRVHGYSFADNPHATETLPVASEQLSKIVVGWNLALDSNMLALSANVGAGWHAATRDVDIMFRGTVPNDWLRFLRMDIEPALMRLQDRCKVIMPRNRVDRDAYYREMMGSKICVSPFGYGEICWRDIEAILCGALLIKPDMGHVETNPDIFRAHETYVPVRWDLADLEAHCLHYLSHQAERERIVKTAFETVRDFYENGGFVRRFREISARVLPTR